MKRFCCVISEWLCVGCLPLVGVAAAPGERVFPSCTDYHCDEIEQVQLTAEHWQDVRDLFAPGASPASEREAIRQAIALLERKVGAITGTWRDLAGNVVGAGRPGQLDCISESKNTSTYLQLLFEDGLLERHTVEARRVRRPLILNVHWSAVIRERASGRRFAVDSWFRDNGEPPYIQPLDEWLAGRPLE